MKAEAFWPLCVRNMKVRFDCIMDHCFQLSEVVALGGNPAAAEGIPRGREAATYRA